MEREVNNPYLHENAGSLQFLTQAFLTPPGSLSEICHPNQESGVAHDFKFNDLVAVEVLFARHGVQSYHPALLLVEGFNPTVPGDPTKQLMLIAEQDRILDATFTGIAHPLIRAVFASAVNAGFLKGMGTLSGVQKVLQQLDSAVPEFVLPALIALDGLRIQDFNDRLSALLDVETGDVRYRAVQLATVYAAARNQALSGVAIDGQLEDQIKRFSLSEESPELANVSRLALHRACPPSLAFALYHPILRYLVSELGNDVTLPVPDSDQQYYAAFKSARRLVDKLGKKALPAASLLVSIFSDHPISDGKRERLVDCVLDDKNFDPYTRALFASRLISDPQARHQLFERFRTEESFENLLVLSVALWKPVEFATDVFTLLRENWNPNAQRMLSAYLLGTLGQVQELQDSIGSSAFYQRGRASRAPADVIHCNFAM